MINILSATADILRSSINDRDDRSIIIIDILFVNKFLTSPNLRDHSAHNCTSVCRAACIGIGNFGPVISNLFWLNSLTSIICRLLKYFVNPAPRR